MGFASFSHRGSVQFYASCSTRIQPFLPHVWATSVFALGRDDADRVERAPRPVSDVVRKSLDNLDRAHKIAREKLKAAAEVTRRFYNRGCRLHVIEYDVGEQAWLRIDQIREFGKLTDKFHGPYYIVSK